MRKKMPDAKTCSPSLRDMYFAFAWRAIRFVREIAYEYERSDDTHVQAVSGALRVLVDAMGFNADMFLAIPRSSFDLDGFDLVKDPLAPWLDAGVEYAQPATPALEPDRTPREREFVRGVLESIGLLAKIERAHTTEHIREALAAIARELIRSARELELPPDEHGLDRVDPEDPLAGL